MRVIGSLKEIVEHQSESMVQRIQNAQHEFCERFKDEIVSNIEIPPNTEAMNPGQFITYESSLKVSDTVRENNVITTKVYSDYTVYWAKKGIDIPVGVFLEWGTGPLGEDSNIYEHGYPYTTEAPWNEHALYQFLTTGIWGIQARPHWWPAIIKYKGKLIEEIEKLL